MVRIRLLAAALVAVSALATGGAHANTLTPCQPRTGTIVDQTIASACQRAAPVIHAVCSLKASLCGIDAASRARSSAPATEALTFQCAIDAMCRVLAIVCPHCTRAESTDVSATTIPAPCPPRPILEQSGGQDFLVVRDPTKPCRYIVVPVPISPGADATR